MIEQLQDFGKPIAFETIKAGLQELCPGLHFDMGGALGMWHPQIAMRCGVYYEGRHLSPIDRGMVPEYKVWSMKTMPVAISIHEAVRDSHPVQFREIVPSSEFFEMGAEKALNPEDENWFFKDGKLFRRFAYKLAKRRDDVIKIGWRHTFEALLNAHLKLGRDLPGITRASLGVKFAVDMLKFPAGAPEEVAAQLFEE